jgi:glutamate racemase
MFDSGTGGLTVLNALVCYDSFNNEAQNLVSGSDGIMDFNTEEFIYFGDQANMPYGNYNDASRSDFLKELILRDALFLLGNKYYRSPGDKIFRTGKESVKLIVIACNTATANGKSEIEEMLADAGCIIKVIGVIDAGVRGALDNFDRDEDGTIAVMATAGTVSSDGYLNTFNSLKNSMGFTGEIEFIQHAGPGIAEAVDEEPNFLDIKARGPRKEYRGPSLTGGQLRIRSDLFPFYNFDTSGNALLVEKNGNIFREIQLNSPENYIRYHLVSLCEILKSKPVAKPLKVLILGCTHYPFYTECFARTLNELYNIKDKGKYVYREVLNDSIIIIDPAINTAREVYEYLVSNDLFNRKGDIKNSQFYISVPDSRNPDIITDSLGRLTFDYKYSRDNGHFYDTKQVPVSRLNTSDETLLRFREKIPAVFDLIRIFNSENEKTAFLKPEERF